MITNIAIINSIITNSYDKNIISILNDLLGNHKDINADVFTTSMNFAIPNKKFSILPIYEAKYFKGKALVWDLLTLDLVNGFPNLSEIIYLHNNTIPWRENPTIAYKTWEKLFVNKKLKIIISDKNIYEIFKLTWETGTFIETIDIRNLYETIR